MLLPALSLQVVSLMFCALCISLCLFRKQYLIACLRLIHQIMHYVRTCYGAPLDSTFLRGTLPWVTFLTRCDCMATHVKQLHVLVVIDTWNCKIYRLSVQWSGKTTPSYITGFFVLIYIRHFFTLVKLLPAS